MRAAASRVLEGCGYHVVTAGSGEEALAKCADDGLEPDLVITDVVMPGLNGHQLVDRLRARRAGLRVLYVGLQRRSRRESRRDRGRALSLEALHPV